jgi:hypothetical protein
MLMLILSLSGFVGKLSMISRHLFYSKSGRKMLTDHHGHTMHKMHLPYSHPYEF